MRGRTPAGATRRSPHPEDLVLTTLATTLAGHLRVGLHRGRRGAARRRRCRRHGGHRGRLDPLGRPERRGLDSRGGRRPGRGRRRPGRGRGHADRTVRPRRRSRRPRRSSRDPVVVAPTTVPPVLFDPAACAAAANHGAYVSYVAHATKGMPDHGALVSAAAHSDCGKTARRRRPPRDEGREAPPRPEVAQGEEVARRGRRNRDEEGRQPHRRPRPRPAEEGSTGQARADPPELRRRAVRSTSGGAPCVPVPHPLGVADHGGVVGRDAQRGSPGRAPHARRGPGAGSTPRCWPRRRPWSPTRWSAARRRPPRRCGFRRTRSGARCRRRRPGAGRRAASACGTVAPSPPSPRLLFHSRNGRARGGGSAGPPQTQLPAGASAVTG